MMSTARSCQPSRAVKLAILGLGLAMLQPALARKDDRQKPANIAAKSFDATQQANGVIHYKGNVLLTQGTLKATGALATAYLDADNSVTRVVITGFGLVIIGAAFLRSCGGPSSSMNFFVTSVPPGDGGNLGGRG